MLNLKSLISIETINVYVRRYLNKLKLKVINVKEERYLNKLKLKKLKKDREQIIVININIKIK